MQEKLENNISLLFSRTSMGENVLEYDGVLLDEGEDDPYFEDEDCSSSEDEFLEIPLNDRFFYKHWKLLEKIKVYFFLQ